jgi:hypothetical protein
MVLQYTTTVTVTISLSLSRRTYLIGRSWAVAQCKIGIIMHVFVQLHLEFHNFVCCQWRIWKRFLALNERHIWTDQTLKVYHVGTTLWCFNYCLPSLLLWGEVLLFPVFVLQAGDQLFWRGLFRDVVSPQARALKLYSCILPAHQPQSSCSIPHDTALTQPLIKNSKLVEQTIPHLFLITILQYPPLQLSIYMIWQPVMSCSFPLHGPGSFFRIGHSLNCSRPSSLETECYLICL